MGVLPVKRRDFLKVISTAPLFATAPAFAQSTEVLVNDVHTGLNPTLVSRVVRPATVTEIQELVKDCRKRGKAIAICGSQHATGGQQFAVHSVLLDMRGMNHVDGLDMNTGILSVESGIEWPELIQGYLALQKDAPVWGIRQKQGGGDRMSLGGALAANAHGHSLGAPPIIGDVEWIDVVDADGTLKRCNRKQSKELFALAIGGYGLFGVITAVGLRLAPRRKVRRSVESRTTAEIVRLIDHHVAKGAPFAYFQYNIDETSLEFMRNGILTTYEYVPDATPLGEQSSDIDQATVVPLLQLAHEERKPAYGRYAKFELSRDGNVEWSDMHQLTTYPLGYHKEIEKRLGPESEGADLIWECYVPRGDLTTFLEDARRILLKGEIPLIYGTVRFIEQDKDSFLPWAKKRYACVIFTPHVSSSAAGMKKAGEVCRQLIQAASKRHGSFYLTYNRFATRGDVESVYPQFSEFLKLKLKYDPSEVFQSDWYRYYRDLHA
jgi:FAD/FMN-containing dehydrogenase